MSDRHFAHWPSNLPRHLTVPATNLYRNVEFSAARYPDKAALIFYDGITTYREFDDQIQRLAGFLQQDCGVARGDRVLLYMQNSPQFVIAYYAILRADAVVVPVNPMNMTEELRHYVSDADARVIIAPQDLYKQVQPLLAEGRAHATSQPEAPGLRHAIVAAYSDYLPAETDLRVPAFVSEPRLAIGEPGVVLWTDAMAANHRPGPLSTGPDDLAVMPYTSGTTGHPKGCMHTHRSVMYNTVAGTQWIGTPLDGVSLAVLPLFHVTGMQNGMNGTLFVGATILLLPRWDRDAAAQLIQRYKVTGTQMIVTMVVDLLSNPRLAEYDLSSIKRLSGGGAAMPEAIATKLKEVCNLDYLEGYGMSETIAPTHINPLERPMKQCLGIPIFDVDARVVDPLTFAELPPGEVGEIIVHGPQVMQGYWKNPAATEAAFVTIDGKRFLRTGDLARTDEHGYFYMVDRLKRMINASGFKVWPAEVEALMYHHPAIQEVCVIAAKDERRGETVKAVVVLKPAFRGQVTEQEIVEWAHDHMAAYKSPRIVSFAESLPKSAAGKVMWRELQAQES
ncbi:MAG: long-chain fatty acid--CoA ligase [Aquabacterium sp.]|jgi:fatty-acyl-CoA synthase|uniref:long-chain fatty acid--CoA ligase n=1 Tax=Aquabacterium sp. TaxID=1872578 RepID=UPI002A36670B|nr:long-chain fatty acid--CoA ligase [Aquabacterium sp.]MDX9845290.1 long-chain fatty acid--CoA ligase [Aquabacterium sp.]